MLTTESYEYYYRRRLRDYTCAYNMVTASQHTNESFAHFCVRSWIFASGPVIPSELNLSLTLASACAAGIIKTPLLYHFFDDMDSTGDRAWYYAWQM